jgi:glutathione S-transferase
MLYLYQGSTSVCSVKVRIALEEKGLAFEGEILDLQRGDQHRPDYAKGRADARPRRQGAR